MSLVPKIDAQQSKAMPADTPIDLGPGYTIKTFRGCRIVFGAYPVRDFPMLSHGYSKKAVCSISLANRMGATMVIGEPRDIADLETMNLPVSQQRMSESTLAMNAGKPDLANWLKNGQRGMSSDAMSARIFGVPDPEEHTSHPYDADDLSRCLKFLDTTHAHDSIGLMRDVSLEWAALVDAWPKIVESYLIESTLKGSRFPRTSEMIDDALDSVTEAPHA